MKNPLIIAGIEITTDSEGRFSLNALHKASGLGDHKRPSKWLDTGPTQELIKELEKSLSPSEGFGAINTVKGGNAPGTFAHELLAVSYAGWISPKFQLQVNRVFIDYKTGRLADAPTHRLALDKPLSIISSDFKDARDLARLFGFEGNQALLSANRAILQIHSIDCAKLMGATHLLADSQSILLTVTEISQRTGIPRNQVNPILERLGLQKPYRDHRNKLQWELTSEGRKYGIYQDTGKKHSNGTPVRQIKWNAELVERLKEALEQVPALNEAAH